MKGKTLISVKIAFSLFLIISLPSCNLNEGKLINGMEAPEMVLPDKNGEPIKLSSLRGKIVLVDFWASWCKPCRKTNPQIVKIYKKYQNAVFEGAEGFEIYSISLDSNRDKWIAAIIEDNLFWPDHVSTLTGWKSSAVEAYDISAIPTSFLIDQNGIIIGKDLRHYDLDNILSMRLAE